MSWGTLSGIPIAKARLTVPYSGIWHADVTLDRAVDIAGPQAMVLGTTTWSCAVVRAIDFAGTRSLRLVGGAGGWRTAVPSQQYASPVGVPTSTVLADVAALVAEIPPVVDASLSPTVGTAYERQAGLASLVLQQVCGNQWWMDPTGTVQTSVRAQAPIVSPFSVESVHGASGKYIIQTESPGDWAPGALFASLVATGTISRVMWIVDESGVRVEVVSADTAVAA